jgi:hypothetical protein
MTIVTNLETSLPAPPGVRVPVRPSEIDAEWLSMCLRDAGVLGASDRVAGFELERIGQGGALPVSSHASRCATSRRA